MTGGAHDAQAPVVGIDIGGTTFSGVLVGAGGETLARTAIPSPAAQGGEAMVAAALGLVASIEAETGVSAGAVGVGTAGVVDRNGSIVAASDTFPGWAGTPLRARLADALGVPVVVENDVNAFLLGEAAHDAETGDDVLGIMIGTGVGGAVILDGSLRQGPRGGAGEIGHTPGYGDAICSCGQVGHLETVAAGGSIPLRYAERTGEQGVSARVIADRARAGDPHARQVFDDAGRALGRACASAATLLDVADVIVGGSVSLSWDLLRPGIDAALADNAPVTGTPLRIRRATLGGDAVALGAAAAARRLIDVDETSPSSPTTLQASPAV